MFRFQVISAIVPVQIRRLLLPHGIFVAHYNRKPIPDAAADSVMNFFFLFALIFVAVAVALAGFGLDFMTSVSGALTALANVGPGLGDVIGPAGNFASLPDGAKWLLSAAMLLGRLCTNLVYTLQPDKIVIVGGLAERASSVVDVMANTMERKCWLIFKGFTKCSIVFSGLGDTAGVLGAIRKAQLGLKGEDKGDN